jgi:hypothetical protein
MVSGIARMNLNLSPRTLLPRLLGVAAICLFQANPVLAQAGLIGEVREAYTDRPIAAAEIRADTAGVEAARTLSDEDGKFTLILPDSGTYVLSVRHIAYTPIVAENLKFEQDEEIRVLIQLDAAAVALEPITIIGRRAREPIRLVQFRERAELNERLGRGRIYFREDLERFASMTAQDLLRGLSVSSTCRHQVLLDGMPTDDRIFGVTADDLEGIEIYRGINQIPPEYYRYGMCGLTMVWTRSDTPNGKPLTWGRAIVAGGIMALLLAMFY